MSQAKEIQEQLQGFFDEEKSVLFAYVFGSVAQGHTNHESDVDLAVYLDENNVDDMFKKRLSMIENCQAILKRVTEIIVLNETASILLRFVIIKEGKVIFERDHGERVDFELKTMTEYYDFQPFLEAYNQAYLQRELEKFND